MKALNLVSWSERQQVLAVILMAGALIFLLWFFALMPLARRQDQLTQRIESMRSQLVAKNYYLGEGILTEKKNQAHKANRALHDEWMGMMTRISAFSNYQAVAATPVGRIDFKRELYDVRQRLLRKARDLNIKVPRYLGMDEAVHSDEDARKLMLQLHSVEQLVDLMLDLKINQIRDIQPRPQILHRINAATEPYLEEYPVDIEFSGTLANLYDLFSAALEPNHVFVLRQIKIEAVSSSTPDQLKVNAVLSGLVFLKDPDELTLATRTAPAVSGPKGY